MSFPAPSPSGHDDADQVIVSRADYEALYQRLEEAETTLRAIRNGEVDALVVHGAYGDQIYTLRSADEPYRVLIEQMQEAALTLSAEGTILYCNQFFARLIGREQPDIIGRSLGDFLAPSNDEFSTLILKAIIEPVCVRAALQAADGRARPIKLALNALRSGGFEGLCAVATDLTDHEEKIQAIFAERLTAAVLAATSDAVLVCDDAGTILRTNEKAINLFGAGCLNQPIDRICQFSEPFGSLVDVREGALANLDVRLTVDAATVYLLGGIRRLADNDLGMRGWVVTLADITRQKDMERALRESEVRFRELATAVPDIVWSADTAGAIDYVNRQWGEYTGIAPNRMFWMKAVHPEDRGLIRRAWAHAFKRHDVFELRLRLRSANGEYRWHQARAVPVKNDTGERVRWLGTCSDIEDLMQAKAELERRAQQLKEADQRKDEFLAILGHELRNPLAGITNGVSLLKRGTRTPEQTEWTYNMIGDQVMQLTRLLNDLLDVARITHGKVQLDKQLLDVRPLVEAAVASARRLIDSRGHDLSIALPGRPLWVWGDGVRLEQIIVNLLTNAAKYTERHGKIALTLTGDDGDVCIRVRDNGVGIAPDMLECIFEPFKQLRMIGRAAGEGLGLGLTLARTLADLHGGRIAVSSAGAGHGSEFTVRLPLARARIQPADRSDAAMASLPAGTRILIVDDNADTVQGLAFLLQELGCEVQAAYDGAGALASVRVFGPQIVLLDIGLPDIDGCEVAKRMRSGTAPAGALLIAVSGFGGAEAKRRAADAGFDHYLVKPVDYRDLVKLCAASRVMAGAHANQAAGR